MTISATPAIQRIARVLAAHQISRNGEGNLDSASTAVDDLWPDHVDTALAVLRTLREPSEDMSAAGDPAVWERMVLTAIGENAPS